MTVTTEQTLLVLRGDAFGQVGAPALQVLQMEAVRTHTCTCPGGVPQAACLEMPAGLRSSPEACGLGPMDAGRNRPAQGPLLCRRKCSELPGGPGRGWTFPETTALPSFFLSAPLTPFARESWAQAPLWRTWSKRQNTTSGHRASPRCWAPRHRLCDVPVTAVREVGLLPSFHSRGGRPRVGGLPGHVRGACGAGVPARPLCSRGTCWRAPRPEGFVLCSSSVCF